MASAAFVAAAAFALSSGGASAAPAHKKPAAVKHHVAKPKAKSKAKSKAKPHQATERQILAVCLDGANVRLDSITGDVTTAAADGLKLQTDSKAAGGQWQTASEQVVTITQRLASDGSPAVALSILAKQGAPWPLHKLDILCAPYEN